MPCARLHTRHLLWEWRLAALGDSAELLVSELVTNAAQASREVAAAVRPRDAVPYGTVRLWLRANGERLLICVWDASTQPPVRAEASAGDEGGRGLLLVDTVSDRWAWYYPQPEAGGGKVVWALLQLR